MSPQVLEMLLLLDESNSEFNVSRCHSVRLRNSSSVCGITRSVQDPTVFARHTNQYNVCSHRGKYSISNMHIAIPYPTCAAIIDITYLSLFLGRFYTYVTAILRNS